MENFEAVIATQNVGIQGISNHELQEKRKSEYIVFE